MRSLPNLVYLLLYLQGFSPGLLVFEGFLILEGLIKFEIQGLEPFSEYDVVSSTDYVLLSGKLFISVQQFIPSIGDKFVIIRGNMIYGNYSVEVVGVDSMAILVHPYDLNVTIEIIGTLESLVVSTLINTGCPLGYWNITHCQQCGFGTYIDYTLHCVYCEPGTFSNAVNSSSCIPCPPKHVHRCTGHDRMHALFTPILNLNLVQQSVILAVQAMKDQV